MNEVLEVSIALIGANLSRALRMHGLWSLQQLEKDKFKTPKFADKDESAESNAGKEQKINDWFPDAIILVNNWSKKLERKKI